MADDPDPYLGPVAEVLTAEGLIDEAELRNSTPRIDETGYYNLNGGTRFGQFIFC
jgi:hypothetical protein